MRRVLTLIAVLVLTLAVVAPVAAVPQQVGGGGTNFVALLTGANEVNAQGVRNQGDPDGVGLAFVNVNAELNRVCWIIVTRNIEPAILAHIHVGPPTSPGPVVVDLMPPLPDPNALGCNNGAMPGGAMAVAGILDNPGNYYVNVHTDTYRAGAIRGQLHPLGTFGTMPAALTNLLR